MIGTITIRVLGIHFIFYGSTLNRRFDARFFPFKWRAPARGLVNFAALGRPEGSLLMSFHTHSRTLARWVYLFLNRYTYAKMKFSFAELSAQS